MGHTYAALFTHFVFSTKDRTPSIQPAFRDRLYSYAGGIAKAKQCSLLVAGGMPDHVHLLIQRHPGTAEADLMRLIKSNTSGWVHETFPSSRDFAWQRGYGVFSVSKSNLDAVRGYIERQEEHHKHQSFKDEFIALLERHGVEYDPKYVWT
jgi:REP element-mobilizing transposase RayT